jgi:hypothetical protein
MPIQKMPKYDLEDKIPDYCILNNLLNTLIYLALFVDKRALHSYILPMRRKAKTMTSN